MVGIASLFSVLLSTLVDLLKKFYWNVVDLQCCIGFYYAAKWISCTNTYTNNAVHQQYRRIPFSPHSLQHLLCILMMILTTVKWFLIVILTCISLILVTLNFFTWALFAISMSSLQKCLFRSSTHFFIRFLLFDIELHELFVHFGGNSLLIT